MAVTFNSGYDNSPHKLANPVERGTIYSGNVLSFDGSNDNVVADISAFGTSDFSITAWISPDTFSNYNAIFDTRDVDGSNTDGFFYGFNSAGKLYCYFNNEFLDNTGAVSLGSWSMVALTKTGNDWKSYVDGVLVASVSRADFTGADTGIGIGGARFSNYYYDGKISNVQIWNVALTLAQVQELYKQPELLLPTGTTASNLVRHYLLNEGAGTTVFDQKGVSHGAIAGATWATGENEIYQTALVKGRSPMVFDGVNDYVNVMAESVITGTGDFTVSCWASWGGSSTRQIWNQRASGDPNPSMGLLVNQATGNIRFETYTSDYQQYINSTSTDLNSNALNHIVCVRDGTTSIKLYVNGALEGSHSAGSAVALTAVPFNIGRNTAGSSYFPGFADEFAMWDVALSLSEVGTLYNSGIPYAATNVQSSNIQGYWRNDGITTWADRRPASSLFKLGHSSVMSFDGTDSIKLDNHSDFDFGSGNMTIDFWCYLTAWNHDKYIVWKTNGTTDITISTDSSVTSPGGQHLRLTVGSTSGNTVLHCCTGIAVDTWFHFAVQRNGTEYQTFLNGVVKETVTVAGGYSARNDSDPFSFMASKTGTYGNAGYMDEIRISNIARFSSLGFTPATEQYASDANTKLLIHSNNTGTTFTDSSSIGHTITVVNDAKHENFLNNGTAAGGPAALFLSEGTTAGKDTLSFPLVNTDADVLNLNGSQYFTVTDNADLDFGPKDFAIEFWILWATVPAASAYAAVFSKRTSSTVENSINLWYGGTEKYYVSYGDAAGTTQTNITTITSHTPTANVWEHLILQRNGADLDLYIDRVKQTTKVSPASFYNSKESLKIGAIDAGPTYFVHGSIDDFRVYHQALSSADIILNWNHGALAHGKTIIE